eukprot:m.142572 g.142572  ORF g.142572 m.142572 type:complete len:503 (+) comp14974_c15_seq5:472-1980(+)
MLLDGSDTGGPAAQPLSRVLDQEPLDDGHGLAGQPDGKEDLVFENRREKLVLRFRIEWRLAGQHFVEEDAESPPIYTRAVRLLLDDLGGNVVGGATEGGGKLLSCNPFLAHAKVCNLDVSLKVEHHIVQLQIAVDDVIGVHEAEGTHNLGGIEARTVLAEAARLLDLKQEIAAVDKLHDEEKLVFGLKARVKRHKKGVFAGQRQHPLLGQRTLHIVVLHKHILLEHLDGKNLLCGLELGKHDLAKAALAQHLEKGKVFWLEDLLCWRGSRGRGGRRRGGRLFLLTLLELGGVDQLVTGGGRRALQLLGGGAEHGQLCCQLGLVQPAESTHVGRAAAVHIAAAGVALQALVVETPEQGAAVVAESWRLVVVPAEAMGNVQPESLLHQLVVTAEAFVRCVCTRAAGKHILMAALVQGQVTQLALVALLAKTPNKVFAVTTEGELAKEASHELVVVHHMHFAPLHRTMAQRWLLLLHKLQRGSNSSCSRHLVPTKMRNAIDLFFG